MAQIELSKEEFLALDVETNIDGFINKTVRHIYNILNKYRDQKSTYLVTYETYFSDEIKNEYSSFGINLSADKISVNTDNRFYLLIIDANVTEETVDDYCKSFVEDNFPEGVSPVYYVINRNMKTYEEFIGWSSTLRKIYPNILPLNPSTELIQRKSMENIILDLNKEIEGLPNIDVTEEIERIVAGYNNYNNTIKAALEAEKSILSKFTGKEVLHSSKGTNRLHLAVFSAYMFYKHGITPHLDYKETEIFLRYLSSLLFDRDRMLVEDQFKYLLNLPDLALSVNSGMEYYIALDKAAMRCTVRVSAMSVDSGAVERMEIDLRDISVIPLSFEYQIHEKGRSFSRSQHNELLTVFRMLEERLNLYDSSVNVTNSFFFELDGIKYLGFVENIDLDLPATVIPLSDELVAANMKLGINDVSTLYPTNIIPGYRNFLIQFIKNLQQRSGTVIKNLGFHKHEHALGIFLDYYYNNSHYLINREDVDFMTVGLWWKETYNYRAFLLKDMCKYLNYPAFRKSEYGAYISIFGGPHPDLHEQLVITESFLKEV